MFLCTVQKSFYLYIIKLQSINIYDSGDGFGYNLKILQKDWKKIKIIFNKPIISRSKIIIIKWTNDHK